MLTNKINLLPLQQERGNTWTHLFGAIFALSSIWLVWPSAQLGWQMAMGVAFFVAGMFLMFISSTLYHWAPPGKLKQQLRKMDHISIYVMIACSYSPICIGVVGGWMGWTVFGIQWLLVLSGTLYKLLAIGRWPKLSLAIYLAMGWSVVLFMEPIVRTLTPLAMGFLLAEGLFYTVGTYFYAHDSRPSWHAIWHVFVLLGAMSHWAVVLTLILNHQNASL